MHVVLAYLIADILHFSDKSLLNTNQFIHNVGNSKNKVNIYLTVLLKVTDFVELSLYWIYSFIRMDRFSGVV